MGVAPWELIDQPAYGIWRIWIRMGRAAEAEAQRLRNNQQPDGWNGG